MGEVSGISIVCEVTVAIFNVCVTFEFYASLLTNMERGNSSGFEELVVWQEARKFRQSIRLLMSAFPIDERYRLTDQLVRASRSISANIAEGYGRYHFQENIQFCRQARGSLTECLDHLICAYDELYITADQLQEQRTHYQHLIKLLNGYIAYLKERKKQLR